MHLRDLGEFGLIAKIKEIVGQNNPDVLVGIDDDAAVVRAGRNTLIITTDAFVEGVHFRWDYFRPDDLGWRLMAANLSDVAAMGAKPRFAFVNLAVPGDVLVEQVVGIYRGMQELANAYDVAIVGGDTTSSPDRWFLSLTLIAEAVAGKFATRSAARVGDVVAVTGYLGSSLAGLNELLAGVSGGGEDEVVLRHLRPHPRVREGFYLVTNAGVRAMIDISDGLASELHHICRMSGVGAEVEADLVPIHPRAREVAGKRGEDPLTYALGGGEDFELLFCISPDLWAKLATGWRQRFCIPLTQIGRIVPAQEGVKLLVGGRRVDLPAHGWQHFRGGA